MTQAGQASGFGIRQDVADSAAEPMVAISRLLHILAKLHEYTEAEIQQFLEEDGIDQGTAAAVRRLLASGEL